MLSNLRQRLDNVDPIQVWMMILNLVMTKGLSMVVAPLLIIFALGIISLFVYVFFKMVLPLLQPIPFTLMYCVHVCTAMFLLFNVMFNYFLCVTTKHKGESYDLVVRELAERTDFNYPEDEVELREFESDFKKKMRDRHRRRMRSSENGAEEAESSDEESGGRPSWVLLGSHEWGFCMRSEQPKPPRSHYDHVSKNLVLNMDHYCPWMANCVGYFNYRYFLNFLIYVFVAMIYAVSITYNIFRHVDTGRRWKHILKDNQGKHIFDPAPATTIDPRFAHMSKDEKRTITFCFMLCCGVGFGVFFLMAFHIFLCASGQTTIEFHGNFDRRRRARHRGVMWSNPYDLGWKRNVKQIYGELSLRALLPSTREPTYLPVPLPGDRGIRRRFKSNKRNEGDGLEVEMGGSTGSKESGTMENEENEHLVQRGGRGQRPLEVLTV